jgi:N-acetylglucosaminyl-diphospho-decaprenol L-rhamnosyltransferase
VTETTDTATHRDPAYVPKIAVVIVTYNSAAVLDSCLRSLPSDGVDLRSVVVADNGSRDDSLTVAKAISNLPILTVELGRNAGYAAAINAGVDAMDTRGLDAVLVLNPDCVLRPDTIRLLWRALERPGCGITVPRLIESDGRLQPSLRRTPTIGRALAEAILGSRAGRVGSLGELVTDPRAYETPSRVAWATGAAMLISTEAMAQIGSWDESFLLYSEETEFALRAADRGWATWYEPAAVIKHAGGEAHLNPKLAGLVIVNKVALFHRRHGAVSSAMFYVVVLLGESVRALTGRPIARAAVAALLRPVSRTRVLAD